MSTAPSAGGLPSLDVFVVARGPGALAPGVHRFHPGGPGGTGRLDVVRAGDPTAVLARALDQPEFAERATVVVALAARLDTTLVKYPPRHYRTLHVDAGVALAHLALVATALGLPGCAVMGFDDVALDALLDLPPASFTAVLFAVGAPAEPPVEPPVSAPGTAGAP